MVQVADAERSVIRIAAVTKCDAYNEKLATFSSEYQSGKRSLEEVAEEMRVDSLRIADAMIAVRVKSNNGERGSAQ
jgi:hypothetical protein